MIKYASPSEGYAHGKASALVWYIVVSWKEHPCFRFGRTSCGSRFIHAYKACRALLFQHECLAGFMASQVYGSTIQEILSSLWSQIHSSILMNEAYALEGVLTAILEPLEWVLGITSDPGAEGEDEQEWDSEQCVFFHTIQAVKYGDTVSVEPSAAASDRGAAKIIIKAVVDWWFSVELPDMGLYQAHFTEQQWKDNHDVLQDNDDLLVEEVTKRELGGCYVGAGTRKRFVGGSARRLADEIQLVVRDADSAQHPLPPDQNGVYFQIDIFEHAINTDRHYIENPSDVFTDCRLP